MRPADLMTHQIPNFGFQISSVPTRIAQIPVPENPNFVFRKSYNGPVVAKPLFAMAHSTISASAPPVPPSDLAGSAWESWQDRRPRPIVPEPSAYGALLLALVVAVVVARRLALLRCPGPR